MTGESKMLHVGGHFILSTGSRSYDSNVEVQQQAVLPLWGRGTALVAVEGFEAVRPNDFLQANPKIFFLKFLDKIPLSVVY